MLFTPKDFGPIKLYGIPHIRTKYIKDFEMHNFRNFIRSTGGGEFPTAQKKNSLKIASNAANATAGDMGYVTEKDNELSDKNILDFHLSHRTNLELQYKPNNNTPKKCDEKFIVN